VTPRPTTQRPRRIEIQRNTPTQSTSGQTVDNWQTIYRPWALQIKTLGGREYFSAQQTKGESDLEITTRYIAAGVTRTDRIKLGSAVLDINDVSDIDEQHQYHRFICKQGTPRS